MNTQVLALTKPLAENAVALSLADARPGQKVLILRIIAKGLLRRRLLDLGFVPGTEIEPILSGVSGNPRVYRVRNTSIALRKDDAELIQVSEATLEKENKSNFKLSACAKQSVCGSCPPQDLLANRKTAMVSEQFIVALAGNPNTGKSTVFNALTGLRQHVGNWTGKTVSRAEGHWAHEGYQFQLHDLPGTYSLLSTSTDEEIARDFILFGAPDCTLVVVDATSLERNLNLVFQILEITDRVIVCVNLMDEAKRKGLKIDLKALEQELGVPVVGTSARSGIGLEELKSKIVAVATRQINPQPVRISYDPKLQQAIDKLLPYVERAFPGIPNARWIAMRLIDGGDSRLRDEVVHGTLADAAGRTGEKSLVGALSPV